MKYQFVAVLAESKNMGDFLNKAEYISNLRNQTKLVGQQTEVQKMIDENKEKLSNIQSEIDAKLKRAKRTIQQEQAGSSTGGNVVSGNETCAWLLFWRDQAI